MFEPSLLKTNLSAKTRNLPKRNEFVYLMYIYIEKAGVYKWELWIVFSWNAGRDKHQVHFILCMYLLCSDVFQIFWGDIW